MHCSWLPVAKGRRPTQRHHLRICQPAPPAESTATTQQNPTFVPAETLSPIAAPTPTVRPTAKPTATRVPQPTALPDDLLHLAGAGVNRPEGFEAEVWLEGIRFPTALLDTDSAGHENDRA